MRSNTEHLIILVNHSKSSWFFSQNADEVEFSMPSI